MRLIYGSEDLKSIVIRANKEEVTEEGVLINFKVHSNEGLMFGDKAEKRIFVSSTLRPSLEHIRHFILDKNKSGVIFISDRAHLHSDEMMNKLLLNKIIHPNNIVFLGQHVFTAAEFQFLRSNKLHLYTMKEISFEGKMEVANAVMSIAKKWDHCYLLVDSSVLNYSTIKENWAGGLSVRELIFFLQRLKRLHNFRTAELVIPASEKRIAVKLIAEMFI